ncbi:MAG: hypothetical protein KI792_01155 [Alphaproteobacteria bacterium]|nr:hypothetical protein [Alphaproteobacteria bacterium SS10]
MSQIGTSLGNSGLGGVNSIQPRGDENSGLAQSRQVATKPAAQSALFQPVSQRSAGGAATPVINVEFGHPAGSVGQIKARLDEQLSAFYRIFYKVADQQQEITSKVVNALTDLIDRVTSGEFDAFQFRFASVETTFSDANGQVFGSTRQFALELTAVSRTENTVSSSSVRLFALDGQRISLTDGEAQTGLVTGLYARTATVEEQQNPVLARQPSEVDDIIASLRQTQEALSSYRDGDFKALNSLIGSLGGSGSTLTFNV